MSLRRVPVPVILAGAMLALLALSALAPGVLEPRAPGAIDPTAALAGPSAASPLGADALGRDLLSRVIAGAGPTLAGPLVLAAVTLLLGTPLALLAGFRDGRADAIVSRSIDVLYGLPALVIAVVVVGVLGGGTRLAVAVLAVLHTPQTFRTLRAAVLERRGLPYVEAAQALGVPVRRLIGRHLLAPIRPILEAVFFVRLTYGLVELSSLSFLGLGAGPGSVNWGRMLADNRGLITVNVWLVLAPGLALVLAAASLNLVGSWLADRTAPRRPRRRGARLSITDAAQTAPVLSVEALRVTAAGGGRELELVADVALSIAPAEAVALVGESGAGKSITARALLDLLAPGLEAGGALRWGGSPVAGRLAHLRGEGISLLLQDPATMLDPLERCGRQIVAGLGGGAGARLSRDAARSLAVDRLAEVGLPARAADRFPFELSGGERQRVAVAAAIARRPRLLIADEPTGALDPVAKRDLLALLDRLRAELGMGLLLITHDLGLAFAVCRRVHVMYAGRIVESAPAGALARHPCHPYSLGLILADPPLRARIDSLDAIPGSMPPPAARPPGCAFAPRCRWAIPRCSETVPGLRALGNGRASRCARIDEIAGELNATQVDLPASRRLLERGFPERAHAPAPTLVSLHAVRVWFGGDGTPAALDGVDLTLAAGAAVGLVGASGAGKTTLARTIVGLTPAGSGQIVTGGVRLPAAGRDQREAVRRTAQLVFQDPAQTLNPVLRVGTALGEAIALGDGHAGGVEALLALVGLPGSYAARRPGTLSGGERQRVSIARALARGPRLLICDEITEGLDVSAQAQIIDLLRGLRSRLGLAMLFISHDLAVVRQLTDELYVLDAGRIVEHGATGEILDSPVHPATRALVEAARALARA